MLEPAGTPERKCSRLPNSAPRSFSGELLNIISTRSTTAFTLMLHVKVVSFPRAPINYMQTPASVFPACSISGMLCGRHRLRRCHCRASALPYAQWRHSPHVCACSPGANIFVRQTWKVSHRVPRTDNSVHIMYTWSRCCGAGRVNY